MDSLLPRIWAVEAVGIGASSRLFLTPCLSRNRQNRDYTPIKEAGRMDKHGLTYLFTLHQVI